MLKIISLNTYAGRAHEGFMKFLHEHKNDTDIFCFQEIHRADHKDVAKTSRGARLHFYQELVESLPEFEGIYAPAQDDFDNVTNAGEAMQFGIALFYRPKLNLRVHTTQFIYKGYNTFNGSDFATLGSNMITAHFHVNGTPLTISTLHGTSAPSNKRDTPERIKQSEKILEAVNAFEGDKIIMGDFNLFPDTESIRLFSRHGFRNLIDEYNISSTRGTLNKTLHPEWANGAYGYQEFADYTFVTPGIETHSFSVPDIPVSDHLPMILTCSQKTHGSK